MLFQLRMDSGTFRLEEVTPPAAGKHQTRTYLSPAKLDERLHSLANRKGKQAEQQRAFYLAAIMLLAGEREQRRLLQRKTARGTRNIELKIDHAAKYAWRTLDDLITLGKGSQRPTMTYEEIADLIRESMAPIKAKLKLPASDPVLFSYTIPDIKFSADCQKYLKEQRPYGALTEYRFREIVSKELRERFPDEAEEVISRIAATGNRNHLAALSIDSKEGQLAVSVVNQRGDLFTLEGWKLLRLVEKHGEALTLGTIDRKGDWQREPVLRLNNNKSGEILAVYTAIDSTLHVVCRQETPVGEGKTRTGTPDRATFMLDQTYLTALYVAILQLKEDKTRFEALREQAEARKAVNINDLFAPGLLEITREGDRRHDEAGNTSGGTEPAGRDEPAGGDIPA
jgi:hypothetical protein